MAVITRRRDVSEAERRRALKEYGNVKYADPTNKKYPIDTEEHVRAAWSYINMPRNRRFYSEEELARIEAAIKRAAKRFGIEISDDKRGR
jgi:hypothetical protein